MKYILFDKEGKAIQYAPVIKKTKDGYTVFNFQNNIKMLQQEGYIAYYGNKPLSLLSLVDGNIVQKQYEKTKRFIFSKLEIRRAMRELGYEDVLNNLLNSNEEIANDWNDAQEINIYDEIFQKAINLNLITQQIIVKITEKIG